MAGTTNFKVDASDYLGLQHDEFKNDLLGLSYSKPSDYIKLRKEVIKSLKTDFTNDIYTTFYNMLVDGTNKAGVNVDRGNIFQQFANTPFAPHVPKQVVSEIALGIAKEFDAKINKIVDEYIIPVDNLTLAGKQLRSKELGERIE